MSAWPSTRSAAWPFAVMGWVQMSTRLLRLSDTISLPEAATVAPGKLNVVAEQPEAPVVVVVWPKTKSAEAWVVVGAAPNTRTRLRFGSEMTRLVPSDAVESDSKSAADPV